jgi:hypothetical protein
LPSLTDTQTSVLRQILLGAPDKMVNGLERALSAQAAGGGAMAGVYGLLANEAAERRFRAAVFGPLMALCRPRNGPGIRFPTQGLLRVWDGLRAVHGKTIAAAEGACTRGGSESALVYDELCSLAAAGMREGLEAFQPAIAAFDAAKPGVEEFLRYLDLAPIARSSVAQLPDWLGRINEERSAAARLAYKDAVAIADDAGPRLLEICYANLAEPSLVLRLVSAVMDHPSDRYVAISELARFGDYILEEVDRQLIDFSKCSLDAGREAGVAASAQMQLSAQAIAEFQNSFELSREGPWGKRVVAARQKMSGLAETRYAQAHKAVDQALPLQYVKFGKGLRGFPKLVMDPDPRLLLKAEGLLAFHDHSRAYANQSGFGAARAKTGEQLNERLDQYVEDLLEQLRDEESENHDRIRSYLEVAAEMVGVLRGEKAAQIVRRRAQA